MEFTIPTHLVSHSMDTALFLVAVLILAYVVPVVTVTRHLSAMDAAQKEWKTIDTNTHRLIVLAPTVSAQGTIAIATLHYV